MGKNVTIVEILDSVMRDVYSINRIHLEKMLTDRKVSILTHVEVREISDKGIAIADQWGKISTLKADTLVLAIGFKPDEGLLESLKEKVQEVYAIGDCVVPRRVINAVWEGFRIARLV
jgi:pyruvate/2-oxoglutarate dehydrogenase complex dihydrolipoamide dehydrogenase (E3) component